MGRASGPLPGRSRRGCHGRVNRSWSTARRSTRARRTDQGCLVHGVFGGILDSGVLGPPDYSAVTCTVVLEYSNPEAVAVIRTGPESPALLLSMSIAFP